MDEDEFFDEFPHLSDRISTLMNRFNSNTFIEWYTAYPVVMLPGKEREHVNYGGKIILPPSALNNLVNLNLSYPMLFELTNNSADKTTHAGVLEFIAEEGAVYLPQWMMQTLLLQPGERVQVKSTNLPPGKFVKIQPQSVDFLDISDPKAALETALRNFSTLTVGDIISITYNQKEYDILVLEIKPDTRGISIVDTDLEVDFAPPVGYVSPKIQPSASMSSATPSVIGSGLEAVPPVDVDLENLDPNDPVFQTNPPPLILPEGTFFFGYPVSPPKTEDEEMESFETSSQSSSKIKFTGEGYSLKSRKNKRTK